MAIFKTARRLEALAKENADLAARLAEVEGFVIDDVADRATAGTAVYSGNAFTSYQKIIDSAAKKYQAVDKWGCVQLGNIVDTRAAFIIGQGLSVSAVNENGGPGDAKSKEMQFVRDFFEYNGLDREMAQELAKEGEIEGCFLGTLAWIEADGQVSLRFMSRVETKYKIVHPANDYLWYQRVEWNDGSEPKVLEEPQFVYARFGGRVHKPNEPTPKVGKCLTEIEWISKALRDWREINRLFGSPVPHIQCATADEAKAMKDAMKGVADNWRVRKLFTHTGQLLYLTPGAEAQRGIETEILTLAKIISGATGVPIISQPGIHDQLVGRPPGPGWPPPKERIIWIGKSADLRRRWPSEREPRITPSPEFGIHPQGFAGDVEADHRDLAPALQLGGDQPPDRARADSQHQRH